MMTNGTKGSSVLPTVAAVVAVLGIGGALAAFLVYQGGAQSEALIIGIITIAIVPTINGLLATLQGSQNQSKIETVAKNTDGQLSAIHERLAATETKADIAVSSIPKM